MFNLIHTRRSAIHVMSLLFLRPVASWDAAMARGGIVLHRPSVPKNSLGHSRANIRRSARYKIRQIDRSHLLSLPSTSE